VPLLPHLPHHRSPTSPSVPLGSLPWPWQGALTTFHHPKPAGPRFFREVLLLFHSPICPGLWQAEPGFPTLGPGWQVWIILLYMFLW
jgi:hypothetical protein